MATAEAPASEAPTRKRGRATKSNYMEENNLKSISVRPSVPDEYDPKNYVSLKENDFDDSLEFHRHRRDVLTYELSRIDETIVKLESIPESQRTTFGKAMDATDSLVAYVRKLQGANIDTSELLAKIQAGLSS